MDIKTYRRILDKVNEVAGWDYYNEKNSGQVAKDLFFFMCGDDEGGYVYTADNRIIEIRGREAILHETSSDLIESLLDNLAYER